MSGCMSCMHYHESRTRVVLPRIGHTLCGVSTVSTSGFFLMFSLQHNIAHQRTEDVDSMRLL